jgi:tetratricopeptide (TPR) repeat protein
MTTADRRVLRTLQVLVLALPLFLGGRHPLGVTLGLAAVLALLVWTVRERARRSEAGDVVGVGALIAFVALALATTVPLPPALLSLLSPDTATLYRDMLPGWPDAGGWSAWRPLALDPHGVWVELCKIGIGLGAFVVLIGYPWRADDPDEDPRQQVFATLVLTLIAGGAALSLLALVHEVGGGERILWLLEPVALPGRASGPFANPNHFAAWLEMAIPLGVAYLGAVALRTGRHVARMARSSQSMGVAPRRAWAGALASHQRSFWLPLLVAGAVLVMVVAHLATGSRGGTMSLLVGLAVVALGFARRRRGARRSRVARMASVAIVGVLVVGSLASVASWSRLEEELLAGNGADGSDVSLAMRVAVAAKGRGIVADFPLAGTGLGAWRYAFPLYQAPPVEGGIWQHAHNDYLELAAETGVVGIAIVLWFALAVLAGVRRSTPGGEADPARRHDRPAGFEPADWRAAFARASWLRFGVCGGIAAILVHSTVDFGLRLPANLLLLGMLTGMLVLTRPVAASSAPARSRAIAAFAALLLISALPLATGAVRETLGGMPASATALVEGADRALAEDGDAARAVTYARLAIDRSPADRATHEALAIALAGESSADGTSQDEGERALRRAIRLDPWAVELRDWLVVTLVQRGATGVAAGELEESIARYPYLVSHALPEPAMAAGRADAAGWLGDLAGSDTMRTQLATMDPPLADAVERGLRRALTERPGGRERQVVVEDLVLLLEARGRHAEAGRELRDAAGITPEDAPRLARAASDFLAAGDADAAQEALVAALKLTPDRGDLYRKLAVDVFAARGDFGSAEQVLRVAQQNSQDMIPVYRGLTRVLTMRESARTADAIGDPRAPGAATRRMSALPDEDADQEADDEVDGEEVTAP